MKYALLLFLLSFLITVSHAKEKVSVVFIINDAEKSPNEIESWTKSIFDGKKKIKFKEARVIHYTSRPNDAGLVWDLNKKTEILPFQPLKIKCGVLEESKLSSLVSAYRNGSVNAKNILMFQGQNFPFDSESWGLSRINPLISYSPDDIYDEISRAIKINKGSKKDLMLFVYMGENNELLPVSINVQKKKRTAGYHELVKLAPSYSNNASHFKWYSDNYLECDTCRSLNVDVTKSGRYIIEAWDKDYCTSASDTIHIELENKCDCLDDMIDIIQFEWKKNPSVIPTELPGVKWGISAFKPGAPVYDVFIKKHCADRFLLEILEPNGKKKLWSREYLKEEVDERNLNPSHMKFPGHYIFRMNLFDIKDLLHDYVFDGLIFRITPIDSEGNKCIPMPSSPVNISECG